MKKDLRKLPREEVHRILTAAVALAVDPFPHGCEKLSGANTPTEFASAITGSCTK